ncbi:MAG: META domain-containing protein [Bacteroidetes bacterium]|nr:META domain-containing protein [Bacteroidota bacterium]
MKNLFFFLLATFIFSSFSSCDSAKHTTGSNSVSSDLFLNQWQLTELEGKPYFSGDPNSANLVFDNVNPIKVYGSTGCNRLNGTVTATSNSVKFSPLATTRMACPGNDESRFLDAISKTDNWKVAGNQLSLYQGDVLLAKFTGVSKKLTANLGGSWTLNYLSGLRIAFDGLYPDKKPHVVFNLASNEMSGNTSCNSFTAKYNMDGSKISFKDALRTMMYCEGGGEEAFLNMLKKVDHYSADGKALTFLIGDIPVMRFTKM